MSEPDMRELEIETVSESSQVLTCRLEGEVVGWSALCPLDPAAAYQRTRQLSVWVGARRRRRGIGGWLIAETVGFAEREAVQTLVALPPIGLPWVRDWLCRQGFKERGRIPQATHSGAGWSDAVVLQLLLEGRGA